MTTQTLAYLIRYLLLPMLAILVWTLLRMALGGLRRAMRRTIQPARDVFLLGEPSSGEGLMNLPVFSMTTIGRAPSCDVRLRDESIAPRHAMIYLFDGDWFLRPLSRSPVCINGVRIQSPTPLEDQDELTLGERVLTFMVAPEYTRLMAEREAWAAAAGGQEPAGYQTSYRTAVREASQPKLPPPSLFSRLRQSAAPPEAAAAAEPAAVNVNPNTNVPANASTAANANTATGAAAAASGNVPGNVPGSGARLGNGTRTGNGTGRIPTPPLLPVAAPSLVQKLPAGAALLYNLILLIGLTVSVLLIPDAVSPVSHTVLLWYIGFFLLGNLYLIALPRLFKGLDPALLLCFLTLTWIGLLIQTRLAVPESLMTREPLFSSGWFARLNADLAVIGQMTGALFGGQTPAADPGISGETLERMQSIFSGINAQYISIAAGLLLIPLVVLFVARTRVVELIIPLCAILTPLMLIATLVLGNGADSHGATLWINIGGFSLQLTEFAKITYLIVVAGFFKNRPSLRMQMFFAGWAGLVFFLIMLLPDLGSAMILLPTTLLVYFVMTSEYITTLLLLAGGTGVSVLAYAIFPHVQRRIIGWTTLWSEVNDSNRQIVYGLQAMVRGSLFGRGLGNGSPGGIPLASSDMIFSVVCEELGLITGLAIVLLFIVIWLRATTVTLLAPDGFRASLALAIGTMLFVEALVVIAGTTGLMPLTGATLPLIAKGGSSALSKLLLLGILLGLSARPRERRVAA